MVYNICILYTWPRSIPKSAADRSSLSLRIDNGLNVHCFTYLHIYICLHICILYTWPRSIPKSAADRSSLSLRIDNGLNVHCSRTVAHVDFKLCMLYLHTHLEGKMSQMFYLGLGFYFMSKNGKH